MIRTIIHKTKQTIKLISLKPFDCINEEGRANERYRRVAITALVSAIAKIVSIITVLVSVPLTLNYLGTERYGLWMTISSLIAMLGFADLGLGNGLLNAIADAKGRENKDDAIEAVSSTFFMLTGIALILGAGFMVGYEFIPWGRVYNVSSPIAIIESGPATAVFIFCFLLSLPLGLVQRIQLGYQEGFRSGLWAAFGSVLGLVMVLVVIYLKAGLPWLVLAMSGSTVVASFLNGVFLFNKRSYLLPRWHKATRSTGLKILKIGLLFFVLQLAVAVAYTSDNIVLAQILGSDAVTQYSVPFKMFSIISMGLSMFLSPLWPAYGEAIARGDTLWVKKTLLKSLKLSVFVAIPLVLVIAIFGTYIIHIWVGAQVNPSMWLLVGLAIWTVMGVALNAIAVFLNGANVMRFQVITALLMGFSALVLKIILTKHFGVSGIVFGTIIATTIFSIIPCIVVVPKIIAKLNVPGD